MDATKWSLEQTSCLVESRLSMIVWHPVLEGWYLQEGKMVVTIRSNWLYTNIIKYIAYSTLGLNLFKANSPLVCSFATEEESPSHSAKSPWVALPLTVTDGQVAAIAARFVDGKTVNGNEPEAMMSWHPQVLGFPKYPIFGNSRMMFFKDTCCWLFLGS